MKKSSGDKEVPLACAPLLIGACVAALGLGLAWRREAARARAASDMLTIHRTRQARHALRAQNFEHDLRSPVGAMAVALELLRTTDDDTTQFEALEVLERQVARMTSLTERMHEFAQGLND